MIPPVLEQSFRTPIVRTDFLKTGGPLKLNLGGAGEGFLSAKLDGFLTVDLRDTPETDIVCDVSWLPMIKDGSVSELYSSNVLEHFSHTDTVRVLSEWARVLKPEGRLWLSVPDLDATIRLYQLEGQVDWFNYLAWGDQAHPLNYHYINFSFPFLARKLIEAGFSDVKRVKSLPYGLRDASEHMDNHHGIRISLNVEATR